MSRTRILVTGFEPFADESINPSEIVVRRLTGSLERGDVELVTAILPVSFRRAKDSVKTLLREHKPEIAMALGLAPGTPCIRVERVALNLMDARIPDNDGVKPEDEPIEPGAPTAYLATIPVKKIVRKLTEEGIPAVVSNTAGTYVCNLVFYELLHHGYTYGYPLRAGFIHLPYLPEQAAKKEPHSVPPSMSLELMIKAVKVVIEYVVSGDTTGQKPRLE
ncbi:pyroglutamyl-peptidase I [Desulfurococcus amylolyticus]|uniref:Pyrrolidone-carboxylate peptidase n=1 Tax=Desulfurococcus amylolyticus DSM 16532 TaxID=768672 RepID=I3XT49_DESAM|nr:pyroglutamyl-peptidase I [Desulfurococcus amylolyticus]AFL67123.1 pyroglutamyl-peptidase I [Desulfurococcus amylolyticus DSM 16532]